MYKENVLDYLNLRILSYYQEALQLKNGIMPAPRMAIFYPTYLCNCKCIGCDYGILNKNSISLSLEQTNYIIDQFKEIGIKGVEFCGGGNASLHSNIIEMVDKIINYGISFGFLDNGTKIEKLADRLVNYGSYCRISVDSGTKEGFLKYKQVDLFNKTIKNMKLLLELRNRNKDSKLQISYKYSIGRSNFKDIQQAIDLAYNLKVDSIQFKLIRNTQDEIKDKFLLKLMNSLILQKQNKYPDFRIINNIKKTYLKINCWLSSLQFTIDAYGDVYICCYYRHRQDKHKLGNIFQKSLKEIWYSKTHWDKIAQIDIEDCNKYDCRFHYYNELMNKLVIEDKAQLNFI